MSLHTPHSVQGCHLLKSPELSPVLTPTHPMALGMSLQHLGARIDTPAPPLPHTLAVSRGLPGLVLQGKHLSKA